MQNGDELHLVYNCKQAPESDDEEDKITLFMGKNMQLLEAPPLVLEAPPTYFAMAHSYGMILALGAHFSISWVRSVGALVSQSKAARFALMNFEASVKKCVELATPRLAYRGEPLFFDIFCDNGLSVIQVVCPGTSSSKVKDLLRPTQGEQREEGESFFPTHSPTLTHSHVSVYEMMICRVFLLFVLFF